MKNNVLIATLLVATFIPLMLFTQTLATSGEEGQTLFEGQKCSTCHAVSSAGIEAKMKNPNMAGPDLKGVTTRHSADWIVKYVKKEENLEGKAHKAAFKGTDEELKAIISWLDSQK